MLAEFFQACEERVDALRERRQVRAYFAGEDDGHRHRWIERVRTNHAGDFLGECDGRLPRARRSREVIKAVDRWRRRVRHFRSSPPSIDQRQRRRRLRDHLAHRCRRGFRTRSFEGR